MTNYKKKKVIGTLQDFILIFAMFLFIITAVKLITDYNYAINNISRLLINGVVVSSLASLAMIFVYRKKAGKPDDP